MDESPVKADGANVRHRAGYKSWKKKYRKMRIVFDQKMHDGEELHKQEDKAAALVKRLAVENDRLLELLLEINDSPHIPREKKIALFMPPPSDPNAPRLDGDQWLKGDEGITTLQHLTRATPHISYEKAKDALPSVVADLQPPEGEAYPADFLTPDDVDNYIYEIDTQLDPDSHTPTLAPRAHPNAPQPSNPHLKNPTSVTNWLRKHAPKVFLQDGETHDAEDGDGGHTGGRKTRGGRGERGGRASTRGKRVSAAARALVEKTDVDASMDDDPDFAATPVGRGKRKRGDNDDAGYKPRGSSTRPTKKKRKSEAADATPSVRKSKKDSAAARDD